MSDFRYIPRSALVGPSASGRIPEHWLKGQMPGGGDSFDHVPLAQFVLLSMLLHALAISLFGAPSGGSREGRAMWGSTLNVLLLAPAVVREAVSPPVAPVLPRVEPPKPRPVPPPAAAPPPPAPKPAPEIPPPPETLPVEAAPTQAPLSFPPLLDRIKAPDAAVEIPALKVPLPLEAPISIPAPVEKVEAPTPKLEMAPAIELPPIREAPPVPAPVPLPAPIPVPPPPAPPVEAAPVPVPMPVPVPAPAPIPVPVAPPPVQAAPVETPALPVPPPPVVTPPVVRPPVEVPAIPAATKPAETAVVPATPPTLDRNEPAAPIREVPPKRESEFPKTELAPKGSAPLPGPSESSPFRTPPKAPGANQDYDPTAPSIDMDAVRKRAGAIAREGTGNRALLPFPMPPKPEYKSKAQIAIENARKPDCKSAYASLGLAAIIPLIANEFGEGTCRW